MQQELLCKYLLFACRQIHGLPVTEVEHLKGYILQKDLLFVPSPVVTSFLVVIIVRHL